MFPKINNIGFGSHGHVQRSEDHENDGLSGFPNEIEKVLVRSEAEQIYGAFGLFFSIYLQTNDKKW